MANIEKNIIITPNIGSSTDDPKIVFSAANTTTNAANITIRSYPTSNGTLSIEGGVGQLFSVTNTFTGTIFSVNDVSGIPSIEVLDTGQIKMAQYSGNVSILSTTASNSNANGALVVSGGLAVGGNSYLTTVYTDNLRYAANSNPWVMGSGGSTTTITISPFLLGGM
jgi:hypothetical protein